MRRLVLFALLVLVMIRQATAFAWRRLTASGVVAARRIGGRSVGVAVGSSFLLGGPRSRRWSSSSSRSSNDVATDAEATVENEEDAASYSGHGSAKKPKPKLRAIRQHVNPLSSLYQAPVDLPEGWVEAAYAQPGLPFHIDIGSARGRFCVDMALQFPQMNFLGLEIRRPCVEEAFKKKEKYGVGGNLHYLALNANVDLNRVVADVQKHSEIVRCKCWL